jgi:hypothetical protein
MEFEDVMGKVKAAAEAKLTPKLRGVGGGMKIMYSWDNDKIHAGADVKEKGFTLEVRLALPPCSSDMHKVIEHVHARLQAKFQDWLLSYPGDKPSIAECKAKVEELFWHHESVAKGGRERGCVGPVCKDVDTLPDTYRAILRANGSYPAKQYR